MRLTLIELQINFRSDGTILEDVCKSILPNIVKH